MVTIRVDPDLLFLASRSLGQGYFRFLEALFVLRSSLARLEVSWQGGRAEDFLAEAAVLLRRLQEYGEELFTMSLILFRQANRWEEMDQRWQGIFRSLWRSSGGG